MELDGAKLRAARLRHMLTLRELAARTGVGFDTLSRLENGHQRPRISTVRKIATVLDVAPEELVDWDRQVESGKERSSTQRPRGA